MMMDKKLFALSVIITALVTCAGSAGAVHYPIGGEGYKAATLPESGLYYKIYTALYRADTLREPGTRKADGSFKSTSFMQLHRLIYGTDIEFLGGNLVMSATLPIVYNSVSRDFGGQNLFDEKRFGLGDLILDPAILSWHGPQFDAVAGVSMIIPAGGYRKNNPASTGQGCWSFLPTAGLTVYLDAERQWSASLLARYEISTRQRHSDSRPGDFALIEYGFGRTFGKYDLSLTGFSSVQVSDTKASSSGREHRNAIGPEFGIQSEALGAYITGKVLFDFENRNAAEGITLMFTLTRSF